MNPIAWLVAVWSLSLPLGYQLANTSSGRVAVPWAPAGTATREEFRRWEAPGGRALNFTCWQPTVPRDGGPMHAVAEWPAAVAGQPVRVYETDEFMGTRQRVLVTYLHFSVPQPGGHAMLVGWGLSRAEFMAVLAGVQRHAER